MKILKPSCCGPNSLSMTEKNTTVKLESSQKRWLAIRTRSKAEKVVLKQLQTKEIEAYLPLLHLVRRYTRKVRTVMLPLIPGYLFVHVAKEQFVKTIETEHVLGFVKFANELATVSEAEIELLRRITGVQSEVEIVPMEYEVGEEVEIASGNLAGMVGILVVVKQKNKVLIELKSINLGLLLEVDINNLLKTKYISAR